MKREALGTLLAGSMIASLLAGCGSNSGESASSASPATSETTETSETGETTSSSSEAREIHYYSSRSASDDVIVSLQEATAKYNEQGGNINLVIDTNADRSSYDQKLRTMIAGGQMPDMYDLDANDYAVELGNEGMLTDMEAFLNEIGDYDSYIELALNYCRTSDGKLYLLPLEFSTEMIWYNTDMFKECGIEAPKTLDDLLSDCSVLKDKGYTAFAIGGGDNWPLLRLLATYPFRLSGNEFVNNLATGKAKMTDPIGQKTSEFMSEMGQYFQEGFSTTDVATGLNLFLSGKAAMYPTGTWELNYFTDANRPEGLNVDYFYMPMCDDAVTKANEYWAFGGIGLSVNPNSFDDEFKNYLKFIVENYSQIYFSHQHMTPQKVTVEDESKFDPLFLRVMKDAEGIGEESARPWDVVLPADVTSVINDTLPGLCMGEITPEEFEETVDEAVTENTAQ